NISGYTYKLKGRTILCQTGDESDSQIVGFGQIGEILGRSVCGRWLVDLCITHRRTEELGAPASSMSHCTTNVGGLWHCVPLNSRVLTLSTSTPRGIPSRYPPYVLEVGA
ncbi:unnamed protein product, partial [Ectocarpus fasciculatus]